MTLFEILYAKKGQFVSGEEIAKELCVSRNAVWKGVKTLQNKGVDIIANKNKGYCINPDCDILRSESVQKYLIDKKFYKIQVYDTLVSTNITAKEKAVANEEEGLVIIAHKQTGGKGRFERQFYSPDGSGAYMSIIVRPKCSADKAKVLTCIAAVSVCEAIEKLSKKDALIKWVNDIFVDNKKVCGILTEAELSIENGYLEYAVVGVGINVYPPQMSGDSNLKGIVSHVFSGVQDDMRAKVIAEVLNSFLKYYKDFDKGEYIEEYKKRSFVIGKQISVIEGDKITSALAQDIDDNCRLGVIIDGKKQYLSSGEISIKIK